MTIMTDLQAMTSMAREQVRWAGIMAAVEELNEDLVRRGAGDVSRWEDDGGRVA